MQIEHRDNRLWIIPETDFEATYIIQYYQDSKVWVKTGLTVKDVLGLVIEKKLDKKKK